MENSPKSGFPWNFTTVVTAQGYCYVKAYKMKWDPVLKKSKRHLQCHVGRLLEDDRIKISPKFSADFPEYSGDDWFWGANKKNLFAKPNIDKIFLPLPALHRKMRMPAIRKPRWMLV